MDWTSSLSLIMDGRVVGVSATSLCLSDCLSPGLGIRMATVFW